MVTDAVSVPSAPTDATTPVTLWVSLKSTSLNASVPVEVRLWARSSATSSVTAPVALFAGANRDHRRTVHLDRLRRRRVGRVAGFVDRRRIELIVGAPRQRRC